MNITQFLNTYYGSGWYWDKHKQFWENPDGRIVVKVMIENKWQYKYVTDKGTKIIFPYEEVEMHENKTSIPKLR